MCPSELPPQRVLHAPEHGSPLPHLLVFLPEVLLLGKFLFLQTQLHVTSEMLLPHLDVVESSFELPPHIY